MRERNENTEYHRVDGPTPRSNDIGSCDRLAVPGRCRMYHPSPEAGCQVEQRLMHRVFVSSPVTFALRSDAQSSTTLRTWRHTLLTAHEIPFSLFLREAKA